MYVHFMPGLHPEAFNRKGR